MKIDLKSLFNKITEKRILVIGDVMLDKYIWGSVDRISPEAPVPIVHIERTDYHSGGAANVARNIHGLGGNVTLIGLIGKDDSGRILKTILSEDEGIRCQLVSDNARETIVKTRIIAQGQQVVRLDRESISIPSAEIAATLKQTIINSLTEIDAVILQDYNKGVFTQELIEWIMNLCQKKSIPVYVDPKKNHFSCFSDARLFKPNLSEFYSRNNDVNDFKKAGELFRKEHNFNMLMITQGEKGMTLFMKNEILQIPTKARAVHDVSGAGDTVIATFVLSDLCGLSPAQSAWLSNLAAGRVCEELGVVPINTASLLDIVNHHSN
ncbi:MAG: D-glycero-beta-D-manno-heptose-7-phosphate kinase [Candidatus Marinimicrobia bacterium]|jgi:rfaE bifunctional protein kinase chain/domain|nr:D-glycero-beta-D-manno-heptose-7-phosphate kinase [Candidatus Neomarinimicrobiota bacterium]MBT3502324.1 D-glycero-beta-D-manno-heptose-7-phosphate kinase [Candidatus Neomarinimicrobiota bacterium]MBT3840394.1 D-glycero-beta-D-manno-heptose-7-phosphate kinase [Candidatus Neomarinimicrobiota bacterium]MBT3999459.1 D-glycero-beta-D-manno-heptose-7-phosphate kinase [Candidatus Neomarinimicrobiota bacterium]MBT4282052.1 D-glycero-beta-D-manno-heptose-7-phosphate kinase [Candidatus Neomarinimicro